MTRIRRLSTHDLISAVAIVGLVIAWISVGNSLLLYGMFARAESAARNEAAIAAAKGDAQGAADMTYSAEGAAICKRRCLSRSATVLILASLYAALAFRRISLRVWQHISRMPRRSAYAGFSNVCEIATGIASKSLAVTALLIAVYVILRVNDPASERILSETLARRILHHR
jgi:hypothetical protein